MTPEGKAKNIVEKRVPRRNKSTGRFSGFKKVRFLKAGPDFPRELVPTDQRGRPVTLSESPPGPVTFADKVAKGLEAEEERLAVAGAELNKPRKEKAKAQA